MSKIIVKNDLLASLFLPFLVGFVASTAANARESCVVISNTSLGYQSVKLLDRLPVRISGRNPSPHFEKYVDIVVSITGSNQGGVLVDNQVAEGFVLGPNQSFTKIVNPRAIATGRKSVYVDIEAFHGPIEVDDPKKHLFTPCDSDLRLRVGEVVVSE